ncbi:N-acetylneuraminate synthase [Halobacillus litoralis]|uniref:N-acetylneuraminate synthase n=1 Tax=Halobacillus litoralis TaxID=45668 RepID=A0A845F6G3_9BACI|nr:N-acetylneuraminate synthase [Halobacillus litoralis]MYL69832.1 N-acetylneuraminate synthase [Halobacillus litoralis]
MSVFIIAEAGVNHNGCLQTAKKLVDKAKESGADCIKFQTFVSKNLASKNAKKAKYQKTSNADEEQLSMLEKLELSFEEFLELYDYCHSKEIKFLSTGFDFDSIDFLDSLGMDTWKVPSGELTNLPYLEKVSSLGKPVILSTGMATMKDIQDATKVLLDNNVNDLTILHCTTEYPTPFEEVNLRAMLTLKETFNVPVGYSDHTMGIEVPIAAVSLGAKVIEKHFTLDRNMEGPDHNASLEPEELKAMVQSIRNIEVAMGTGTKAPSPSEMKNMSVARKSIVAKKAIQKGEYFDNDNLTVKRPGNGVSPMKWYEIIGEVANRDYQEDEMIDQ